jgi:N-acetylneuraminate synthase
VGCSVLELHVTLSREMFGPDVPASVTTAELKQIVEGARYIERMRASPVDKDEVAVEMRANRKMFGKSLVARMDLPAGTRLERRHVSLKKPGFGLPEDRLENVLHRTLKQPVERDSLILEEQFE